MKASFYAFVLASWISMLPAENEQNLPSFPKFDAWRKNTGPGMEKTFKPVLNDKSIQFGNKTLQLSDDGRIVCMTKEYGTLLTMNMYFHVTVNGKEDYNWRARSFDAANSKFSRNGNQYRWDLQYRGHDEKNFVRLQQFLEVLPDGRLKFSAKFTVPKPTKTHIYRKHLLHCYLKDSVWTQENVSMGGKPLVLTRSIKPAVSNAKKPVWTFGTANPAKKITLSIDPKEMRFFQLYYRKFNSSFAVFFHPLKLEQGWYTVYFDFTKGVDPGAMGKTRGGVNFMKQENMTLPDIHEKNMVLNPSLECGLDGWTDGRMNRDDQWGWKPFMLDNTTAWHGKTSLKFNARYSPVTLWDNPSIALFHTINDPGNYTFSFYAKGEPGKKTRLIVWSFDFHGRGKGNLRKNGSHTYELASEWKRYSFTFKVSAKDPVVPIQFCAVSARGTTSSAWVDALQLEKGNKPTAFQPHAVEGSLLTSNPGNFISASDPVCGRLRIVTARPNSAGHVLVTVKNFFDETLLKRNFGFKTTAENTAELNLPLDSLPGLGIFTVKCEYQLDSGEKYYDHHRYAKIQFQDMPRPNKRMFSSDYGNAVKNYRFISRLERWKKLGIGSSFHHGTLDKKLWDMETRYNVIPYCASILSYIRKTGKILHFCIVDSPKKNWDQKLDDPLILLKDYHLDSNGTITPEYQEKLKNAVKTLVKKYPHVKIWMLGGELTCKFPNEWWGKGFTDRDVARSIAMLLKPFVEGVKEANPKAKVFQDCPANMSPRRGIAETDLLLEECNKLGVKFDVICIHPYRYSPEDPDTDSDAQVLFTMLKKHGYDKTPVIWPEGMHWGPFDIPQWGIASSTWVDTPPTWTGSISYDMGWTEKKSAAWYARAWLVGLKYRTRVIGFTAGNNNNNSFLDWQMTPYAAQLIPNTLSCILGDAKFVKDIRTVPFLRTYVFEDAQNRPVAVTWNHHEDVDNAKMDPPMISADFGTHLESVLDLMNSPRRIAAGKIKFQVSTFPLFFRGKPGTLKQMISAFENAELGSGSSFSPLTVSALPVGESLLKLTLKNSLSREFQGSLNGKPVTIPSAASAAVNIPLPIPLKADKIITEKMKVNLKSDRGASYSYDVAFNAFKVKRIPDTAVLDTVDWSSLPAVQFPKRKENKTSGEFRLAWNKSGIFLETRIRDSVFVHVEYPNGSQRWKNDSLQIFIDTFANARDRHVKGFDEDDYAYAVYPNAKGNAARMFRFHSVESQLGLATQAPPDNTFADDIPCRFSYRNGVLTYRTFIPAKYLLPIRLQKNCAFGFALFANNSDQPEKLNGKSLTLASDGGGCYNRPHVWPVAVLTE